MSDTQKPMWWHLLDRAYKMMEMAGYRLAEHDPNQNDPIAAWMSDARIMLQAVPEADACKELRAALVLAKDIVKSQATREKITASRDVTARHAYAAIEAALKMGGANGKS